MPPKEIGSRLFMVTERPVGPHLLNLGARTLYSASRDLVASSDADYAY